MSSLSLTSMAFSDGEPIPEKYGYTEQNVNPPLDISGIPSSATSLALIVDDPDAKEPAGKIWDHWVVWNIDPSSSSIPEDWDADQAVEGENDYGEIGYGGPNPPDREHTYHFRLYALDSELELRSGSTKDELKSHMSGHVLDQTELTGTYTP